MEIQWEFLGDFGARPGFQGKSGIGVVWSCLGVSGGSCANNQVSEAWGPPQFQEKRSRSEKAILGALREFRGILGATLGIRNSILGIRNSILGMASHDLSNMKTTILGATPGAIPGIHGNPHEKFSFAPAFSERFFKNWGGPRAPGSTCKCSAFQPAFADLRRLMATLTAHNVRQACHCIGRNSGLRGDSGNCYCSNSNSLP